MIFELDGYDHEATKLAALWVEKEIHDIGLVRLTGDPGGNVIDGRDCDDILLLRIMPYNTLKLDPLRMVTASDVFEMSMYSNNPAIIPPVATFRLMEWKLTETLFIPERQALIYWREDLIKFIDLIMGQTANGV